MADQATTMETQMHTDDALVGGVDAVNEAALNTGHDNIPGEPSDATTKEPPAHEPSIMEQLKGLHDTVDEDFCSYFCSHMQVIFIITKPDLIYALEERDIIILKQIREFLLCSAGNVFADCEGREAKTRRTPHTVCQDIHTLGSSILAKTKLPDFSTVYKSDTKTLPDTGDTDQYMQTPVEADITQIWHDIAILSRNMTQRTQYMDITVSSQLQKITKLESDYSALKDTNDTLNNKIARAESAQARQKIQFDLQLKDMAAALAVVTQGMAGQVQLPAQVPASPLPPSPPPRSKWLLSTHSSQDQGPLTGGHHSLVVQGMVHTLPPQTQWLTSAVQHASGAQAQGSPTALQPPLNAQRMQQASPPPAQGSTTTMLPNLSAAPSYNVFIGNLSETETDQKVHDFLIKRTGIVSEHVVVHEIPQRNPGSKAFKVSVPQDKKQAILNLPWPQNTRAESYSAKSNKAGNAQPNNSGRNGSNNNRNNPISNNRHNGSPPAFRKPPHYTNGNHGSVSNLPTGSPGPQWQPGPAGTAPPQGHTWAPGPPWLSGPAGPTVPTSPPGPTWPPSPTGPPGTTGPLNYYNSQYCYQQPPYQQPFCQPPFYQQPRISY